VRKIFGPPVTLSDGVVTMRALTSKDVAAVTAACQGPEMARWTAAIPSPYYEQHAIDWIAGLPARWRDGREASFALVDASSDELWGNFCIMTRDWKLRRGGVGYWVAAPARSQGVATRALLRGCAWAFEDLGFDELHLETLFGNVASERVAQKGGFTFVEESYDVRVPSRMDRTFDLKRWRRRRGDVA